MSSKYIALHKKMQSRGYSKSWRRALIIFFPFLFIFFIILTISPIYFFYRKIDIPLGIINPVNIHLGIIISISGLIIYIWTIILFARVDGTQVPLAPTQDLVTTGPYSVTRNPMLTGAILFVLGLGIILNSLTFILLCMIIPAIYLLYIKLVEERELVARFGEKYIDYKKRTPFFIPNLKRRR